MPRTRVAPGIYKVGPGAYDLHVSAGKDPNGKYAQLTRRVRGTLGEAKAERGRMLAEVRSGQLSARSDITVAELHRQFMAIKTKLSPASIAQYEYVWQKLRPHVGDRPGADFHLCIRKIELSRRGLHERVLQRRLRSRLERRDVLLRHL